MAVTAAEGAAAKEAAAEGAAAEEAAAEEAAVDVSVGAAAATFGMTGSSWLSSRRDEGLAESDRDRDRRERDFLEEDLSGDER
jgi:hypothetical protein